jgi:peptide methionine sulfoxide reductase MsrB
MQLDRVRRWPGIAGKGLGLALVMAAIASPAWPTRRPIADENVVTQADHSHGMARTVILCARCDDHLGHVFADGPPPTGLRYCDNSESLAFTGEGELAHLADSAAEQVPS